ncbi:hypothetical protein [Lacisediminihabitans sp.]|uniref:hypothetical protein n=1 Tax=Lacisediminihabitans sp. TaxID=2787631 RepID=UPI00374DEBE1
MPSSSENWDNWASVLNAMEESIAASRLPARADAEDYGGVPVWVMPSYLGPMPPDLRTRANRIFSEQQESIDALEERKRVTGRHLAAIEAVPPVNPGGPSAYLDVTS